MIAISANSSVSVLLSVISSIKQEIDRNKSVIRKFDGGGGLKAENKNQWFRNRLSFKSER